MRGSYGGPGVVDGFVGGPGSWPYGGPAVTRPGPAGVPAGPPAPRRRRRWLVAGSGASAVAVAVVAVVGLHGGTVHSPTAPAGSGAGAAATTPPNPFGPNKSAAQRAAAVALFAARSAALGRGDLAGWLAPVDPDQPALRAAEKTLFTNLRQLPLASYRWSLDTTSPFDGDPVPDAVTSTLVGASAVFSPGMSITYRLRGFDAGPVADAYVPVLLERGGTWYLAADRTPMDSFGQALVEPWTQGPVKVKATRHSLVIVSASDAARLPALSAQADAAVAAVASLWPRSWSHKAVLYATRSKDVFATFLGRQQDVSLDDAVTLGVGLPGQGRAHESTRVVLNPQYVLPGYSRMGPVLRHEFTHVATWTVEKAGTPLWVTEGIAEYTAYRGHVSDQRVSFQIGKDARAHRMSPRLPATSTFYGGPAQSYHYGVAWLAWEYMSETYGEPKLRVMYLRLAAITAPPDSRTALRAESAAFVAVLQVSEASYVRALNSWIAQVLGPV